MHGVEHFLSPDNFLGIYTSFYFHTFVFKDDKDILRVAQERLEQELSEALPSADVPAPSGDIDVSSKGRKRRKSQKLVASSDNSDAEQPVKTVKRVTDKPVKIAKRGRFYWLFFPHKSSHSSFFFNVNVHCQ